MLQSLKEFKIFKVKIEYFDALINKKKIFYLYFRLFLRYILFIFSIICRLFYCNCKNIFISLISYYSLFISITYVIVSKYVHFILFIIYFDYIFA